MRFYINGRFLTQPLSGMQRYAGELISALDKLQTGSASEDLSFVVLVPKGPRADYGWRNISIREVGGFKGHLWEQIDLAYHARDGVLLNLTSSGPLAHRNSVLVMHDAAVFAHPAHFSLPYRSLHRALRPRLAKRALRLVTISEFSRGELARWCKVPEQSFTIVADSAEHISQVTSDEDVLTRHGLSRGRYALTVGNQSPNKNIDLAVRAFSAAAPAGWSLAVAGSASGVFGEVRTLEGNSVKRLGRVTDGELRALYENAGLFLFPSKYEGFGVPPLEAMTLKCPVLSSDSSAMPEVLGSAAMYFREGDLLDFSRKITLLCEDPVLRSSFSLKGVEKSHQYSWNRSGQTLIALLRSVAPAG